LTNPVAVGDKVIIKKIGEDWMIDEIMERENYIIRKASKLNSQYQIVASNLDQAAIICSLRSPRTSTGFIDRFLVSCESFHIQPIIIINKTDLLKSEDLEVLEEWCSTYSEIGYTVFTTSFATKSIPSDLLELFSNKSTLLFGHSGVGKSTLLNLLLGEERQKTNELSSFHDKGRHTTTFAAGFEYGENGQIIDTPGIKEFGLAHVEDWQLSHFMPDLKKFISACNFHNCLHLHEPKCGVKDALLAGGINPFRYGNYMRMLETEFDKI
jgi:ribosome biogenesis GTPase